MNKELTGQILAEQRPVLFRYALLQLYDSAIADDVVQETLLAALQSCAEFEGKSSLRTWLIGILKHKVADHWRRNKQEEVMPTVSNHYEEGDSEEDEYFLSDGHWMTMPKTWANPETAVKQMEFWVIYETCQKNLPPAMAKVFMLRELVGLETPEVCQETGISESSYWVTMHRARLRLRECLEISWFDKEKPENNYV